MRKLLALAVGAALTALACGAPASAQQITRSLQASQDATGVFGLDANFNLYIQNNRHLLTSNNNSPPPVLSACVTGGTPGIAGTDFAGVITAGSTASTSCVVTFGTAFVTAPNCVVTWQAGGPPATYSWTTSTTALTITQASTGSAKIAYVCTSAS
jgi:hypothetical protein